MRWRDEFPAPARRNIFSFFMHLICKINSFLHYNECIIDIQQDALGRRRKEKLMIRHSRSTKPVNWPWSKYCKYPVLADGRSLENACVNKYFENFPGCPGHRIYWTHFTIDFLIQFTQFNCRMNAWAYNERIRIQYRIFSQTRPGTLHSPFTHRMQCVRKSAPNSLARPKHDCLRQ